MGSHKLRRFGALTLLSLSAAPAFAQQWPLEAEAGDPPPVTAEDVIAEYERKVKITRARCPERTSPDEIIVCAQDDSEFRVPPDTTGRLATGGPPPAPDVAGPGIFKGPPTFVGSPDRMFHCTTQNADPPCAFEPDYLIDFSQLPDYDPEYAAIARAAAAEERLRQTQAGQAADGDEPE